MPKYLTYRLKKQKSGCYLSSTPNYPPLRPIPGFGKFSCLLFSKFANPPNPLISTLFTLPVAVEFTNRASLSLALLGIPDMAPTYDSLTLVGLGAQHQAHRLHMYQDYPDDNHTSRKES